MFCQPCLAILRKIRFGSPREEEPCPHHETFADLCDAANHGCPFCQRLRLRFIEGEINGSEALLHHEIQYRIYNVESSDRVCIGFGICASEEGNDEINANLELVAVPPSEGTAARSRTYRFHC